MLKRISLILVLLLLSSMAFAQNFLENIASAYGNEELLYSSLILPIVQFLKGHTPLSFVRQYGKWGVIGLSIVVGILVTAVGKVAGIGDMELLTWFSAVSFGAVAGATGSGFKDFLKSVLGGKGAPPTDNNTTRAAMDRARSSLR